MSTETITVIKPSVIRPIVFTRFPEDFNRTLRKNFTNRGITPLYFGDVNQDIQRPEGANCVLTFFEFMGHSDTEHTKEWAKKWGLRHIQMSRKAASWEKVFAPLAEALQREAQNTAATEYANNHAKTKYTTPYVPPVLPELVEEEEVPVATPSDDNDWHELEGLYKEESKDLRAKLKAAETENSKIWAERKQTVEALQAAQLELTELRARIQTVTSEAEEATAERQKLQHEYVESTKSENKMRLELERINADLGRARAETKKRTEELAAALNKVKDFEKGLVDQGSRAAALEAELAGANKKVDTWLTRVTELEHQNSELQAKVGNQPKASGGLDELGKAMRTMLDAGLIDESDVKERLFKKLIGGK